MSLSATHAVVLYGAVALISDSGPTPISVFSEDGRRTDGVAVVNDRGILFYPLADDYGSLGTPVLTSAANWGPLGRGSPQRVEVLMPNGTIVSTVTAAFPTMTPEHVALLSSMPEMNLVNTVLTDFVTDCLAFFTDPKHPPSWTDLCVRWRMEGSPQRQHFCAKLRADDARFAYFAATVERAVMELRQRAATVDQVAALQAELEALRVRMAAQEKLQQDLAFARTSTANTAAQSQPLAASDGLSANALMELAKALAERQTPKSAEEEFTADIRDWGPLRDRYGSWDGVRDRLYRALHIVPNARKSVMLEMAFESFDNIFGVVFSRWDDVEALSSRTNADVVETINCALRRLILTVKKEQGLSLKSDVSRRNVAALERHVLEFMKNVWSDGTWAQMRSLWARLNMFLDENGLEPNEMNCILFLHSLPVSQSTKHTYTRYLINIYRKMGWQHSQLSLYDSALRSTGGAVPRPPRLSQ